MPDHFHFHFGLNAFVQTCKELQGSMLIVHQEFDLAGANNYVFQDHSEQPGFRSSLHSGEEASYVGACSGPG